MLPDHRAGPLAVPLRSCEHAELPLVHGDRFCRCDQHPVRPLEPSAEQPAALPQARIGVGVVATRFTTVPMAASRNGNCYPLLPIRKRGRSIESAPAGAAGTWLSQIVRRSSV